jgi:hypothetical protein
MCIPDINAIAVDGIPLVWVVALLVNEAFQFGGKDLALGTIPLEKGIRFLDAIMDLGGPPVRQHRADRPNSGIDIIW